jgi:hypothetical protein
MWMPFHREIDDLFQSDRSIWMKAGGAALLCGVLSASALFRDDAPGMSAWIAVGVIASISVVGAIVCVLLSLKDVVRRRLSEGKPVHLLLRICFGSGPATLLFLMLATMVLLVLGVIAMDALHIR